MSQSGQWPVSVCTWSVQNDFATINRLMERLGFRHVHLDLRPVSIDNDPAYLDRVGQQGWHYSATMIGFPQEDYTTLQTIQKTGGIVPDECWEQNKVIFESAIKVTSQLGVTFLSSHIGFIDHTEVTSYQLLKDRFLGLADLAGELGVKLLLETGQETAQDLQHFLEDLNHSAVGVNFDPANMILYGKGKPLEAVRILANWIDHIHIKDAVPSAVPGTWGSEVVWGEGQAGGRQFLQTLKDLNYGGALAVEREGGDQREADIQTAIKFLMS